LRGTRGDIYFGDERQATMEQKNNGTKEQEQQHGSTYSPNISARSSSRRDDYL